MKVIIYHWDKEDVPENVTGTAAKQQPLPHGYLLFDGTFYKDSFVQPFPEEFLMKEHGYVSPTDIAPEHQADLDPDHDGTVVCPGTLYHCDPNGGINKLDGLMTAEEYKAWLEDPANVPALSDEVEPVSYASKDLEGYKSAIGVVDPETGYEITVSEFTEGAGQTLIDVLDHAIKDALNTRNAGMDPNMEYYYCTCSPNDVSRHPDSLVRYYPQ
jgi:hypothetical protein